MGTGWFELWVAVDELLPGAAARSGSFRAGDRIATYKSTVEIRDGELTTVELEAR